MNLIDDKFNAKLIARLLDTNRLTFEEVLPEMRNEVLQLAASFQNAGFDEIPRSYHTPEIASMAANTLAKSLHYGDLGNDYYQVATKLISDGISLNYIHPDYVDSKLILINLRREDDSIEDSVRFILRRFRHLVDVEILNFVASRSLNSLDDLLHEKKVLRNLSIDHLYEGLVNETWMSHLLIEHGRLDVLSKAIQEGHWPKIDIGRPPSLMKAIDARMTTKREKTEQIGWLNAYIANFPANEVFRYMDTEARCTVLMDIFPAEQLLEFVKEDKAFSGKVLERSMGL